MKPGAGPGHICRLNWLDAIAGRGAQTPAPGPVIRETLTRLDRMLYDVWGLGDNLILVWTREGRELRFLDVRHYAIIEGFAPGASEPKPASAPQASDPHAFINGILAGPKFVLPGEFASICGALGKASHVVAVELEPGVEPSVELVSSLVTRYSVSLVRERAVVLLDAVGFSLRSPLEQMAMLNSLSYSVNSAYSQLLSNDIEINFARTTTGDGFYIWNRVRRADANIALYKLMMLILADNAVAQRKARQASCRQKTIHRGHSGIRVEVVSRSTLATWATVSA